MLLFVVDVLNAHATFLPASPAAADLVHRAWGVEPAEDGTYLLPGVLSRKKQIIPKLEAASDLVCPQQNM